MHANKSPNWRFHTLVIDKALDFLEQIHTAPGNSPFDVFEAEIAISESRDSLRYLQTLLQDPSPRQTDSTG